jgi:hypothetical protein
MDNYKLIAHTIHKKRGKKARNKRHGASVDNMGIMDIYF